MEYLEELSNCKSSLLSCGKLNILWKICYHHLLKKCTYSRTLQKLYKSKGCRIEYNIQYYGIFKSVPYHCDPSSCLSCGRFWTTFSQFSALIFMRTKIDNGGEQTLSIWNGILIFVSFTEETQFNWQYVQICVYLKQSVEMGCVDIQVWIKCVP